MVLFRYAMGMRMVKSSMVIVMGLVMVMASVVDDCVAKEQFDDSVE